MWQAKAVENRNMLTALERMKAAQREVDAARAQMHAMLGPTPTLKPTKENVHAVLERLDAAKAALEEALGLA
jgi:hypothetical protein